MGLSNSQRELLLNNININNYVNDMIPVSEQIVFSSTDVIHERTIEETKDIKVYRLSFFFFFQNLHKAHNQKLENKKQSTLMVKKFSYIHFHSQKNFYFELNLF